MQCGKARLKNAGCAENLSACYVRAIRDGEEKVSDTSFVVSGAIICLEADVFNPADARLLARKDYVMIGEPMYSVMELFQIWNYKASSFI